jgi:hypothetical protein
MRLAADMDEEVIGSAVSRTRIIHSDSESWKFRHHDAAKPARYASNSRP